MSKKVRAWIFFRCVLLFLVGFHHHAFPADLPHSTKEMISKLKLDPSLLTNIERELRVPAEWVSKAKEEGKLRILSTSSAANPQEMGTFYAPFRERYPFIDIEQSGASLEVRVVRTLLAYKRGKVLADIVADLEDSLEEYKNANALEDLRNIPGWGAVPDGVKDPSGQWVSPGVRYYCMAYNTKLVDRKDLPARWEDLLQHPRWRGGNLALVGRPERWVVNLWATNGEQWVRDFLRRLFTEVKPQRRKEGLNASLGLLAAGEYHAVIPSQSNLVYQKVVEGAPLGFNCPEPVPVTKSEIVILKGASNIHAARVFVNWLISSEGQISQFFARNVAPSHKDLMRVEFVAFAEQILGKKHSYVEPTFGLATLPKLQELWKSLWLAGRQQK